LAKFRFALETLLRHREDLEQKERDELLRRTYKYQLETQKRNDLTAKFQETMKELSFKRSENTPQNELDFFYLYLNRLTHEIRESEKRLSQLQAEVQSQKEVVIEASKKKKTLATMRGKKEREFMAAADKQEQKEVDELVVTRYGNKEPEYSRVAGTEQNSTHTKRD
jgi:flagellar export protein FliJ